MDGTLYQFDKEKGESFKNSRFAQDLKKNIIDYFIKKFKLSYDEALRLYKKIQNNYKGEISTGVEKEFGILRAEFFEETWNLYPEKYIIKNTHLPKLLLALQGNCALVTSAPTIWATRVLEYLEIADAFGDSIYTAESYIRKPNPLVFLHIARKFNSPTCTVISIGDQEATDIIPAAAIGMRTIYVGSLHNTSADYHVANIKDLFTNLRKEGMYEEKNYN